MKKQGLVLLWILMFLIVGMATAADYHYNWTGYNSSSWWDPNDWTPIGVPQSTPSSSYFAFAWIGKSMYIYPLEITDNADPEYQTYLIDMGIGGGTESAPTTVDISGGNIYIQGSFRQNWGDGAQYSIINMSDGRLETRDGAFMLNCDGRPFFGSVEFNMTGGYLKVNNNWLNTFQEETKPGISTVNISGTAQIDTRGLFVGERGQSTMTVSENAVINCDELFIKGWNASYNGFVSPELIVNSDIPITTPCISVKYALSLHQDPGPNLTQAAGNAKLTINSGYVRVTDGNLRLGNVGQATLTMTGGKLEIQTNVDCGINTAQGNDGYAVTADLSGGELWADDLIDHGNATTSIYVGDSAAIYLRNPDRTRIDGYVASGLISPEEPNEQKIWIIDQIQGIKIIAGPKSGIPYATDLSPSSGAEKVHPDVVLSWTAGVGATLHDVYFGTDADAVANATTASPEWKGTQTETTFDPLGDGQAGWLTNGQQYFWRIDEGAYKGDVATFTVVDCSDTSNGDLSGDCMIDLTDFAMMAEYWLKYSWQ